jgi:Peptidase family M28
MLETCLLSLALGLPGAPFPYAKAEAELSEEIRVDELKAHVYRLASPEFLGRRGAGAARASRHIAAAFERLNLRPAFGDSYFQAIPALLSAGSARESFIGRNVGAVLPGTDPKLRDQWILVGAHFDHLGKVGTTLYPGADDNATGVAVLLELAEHFALRSEKPRRTILFVGFDQEEAGLLGSSYFAAHPPCDIHNLKACLTADMLGRSMANVMDEYVYALGSEKCERLRELLEQVKPEEGLKIGRIGADLIGTRSDYGPFRDRRVPFLFFSTGQHPDYHQPTDLPDRVDYVKLRKIAVFIAALTWRLANDNETPAWSEAGLPPDLNEVETISLLLSRVLAHPGVYPLTSDQRVIVESIVDRLGAIRQRGHITSGERTWLVWTARLLMVTLF